MAKRTTPEDRANPSHPPARAQSPLEQRLGYAFQLPALLQQALTHRSFIYESRGIDQRAPKHERATAAPPGADNEQMEFLGDAVLGLAVADALYKAFPGSGEGELTRLRATLVSRKHMATVGEALGLRDAMLLGESAERTGVRRKPTLLANAAEAVIAAVYLDGGFEAARHVIERTVIAPEMPTLRKALADGGARLALRDHKTLLQERVQATGAGRLRYVDVAFSGPAHQRRFVVEAHLEAPDGTRVLASAEGASKKEAQQLAAERALAGWNEPAGAAAGENAA